MQQMFYHEESPLRDSYEPVGNHNSSTISYQKLQYDKRYSTSTIQGQSGNNQMN